MFVVSLSLSFSISIILPSLLFSLLPLLSCRKTTVLIFVPYGNAFVLLIQRTHCCCCINIVTIVHVVRNYLWHQARNKWQKVAVRVRTPFTTLLGVVNALITGYFSWTKCPASEYYFPVHAWLRLLLVNSAPQERLRFLWNSWIVTILTKARN